MRPTHTRSSLSPGLSGAFGRTPNSRAERGGSATKALSVSAAPSPSLSEHSARYRRRNWRTVSRGSSPGSAAPLSVRRRASIERNSRPTRSARPSPSQSLSASAASASAAFGAASSSAVTTPSPSTSNAACSSAADSTPSPSASTASMS